MTAPDEFPPRGLDAIIPRAAQASSCEIQFEEGGDEHLMLLVEFHADDRTQAILLGKEATEILIAKLTESLIIWHGEGHWT